MKKYLAFCAVSANDNSLSKDAHLGTFCVRAGVSAARDANGPTTARTFSSIAARNCMPLCAAPFRVFWAHRAALSVAMGACIAVRALPPDVVSPLESTAVYYGLACRARLHVSLLPNSVRDILVYLYRFFRFVFGREKATLSTGRGV